MFTKVLTKVLVMRGKARMGEIIFLHKYLCTQLFEAIVKSKAIWAPSSEFVSSSIPSWQISTAHIQPFRGARDLVFCLKVPLDSLLVWASSEGSGETARMRRLAWTFTARIGDKYQIRLMRSIFKQLKPTFFNMVFTWKSTRRADVWLNNVTWHNIAARLEHFVYAFIYADVVSQSDVFDVRFCKLTPFCTTRFNLRNTIILLTFWRFLCVILDWSQVKCKNNDHLCFVFH